MNYNKTLNLPKTKFSMKANLPNREPEIQKFWKENEVYGKVLRKNKDNEAFILHDGPPYANGHIHLGHALNRVLKDMVLKYKSMRGYYTPFVPGWDCHGLPVEYELIKALGESGKENKVEFRKKAAEYALKFVDIQRKEFKRLGLFGEWDNPYLTLSRTYEEKIIECFRDLYLKGYIYRELKPVYWCMSCKTALAEAEVEYENIKSPSVYVKFKQLSGKPEALENEDKVYALVWTTTPWTLPSNVALCFHPSYEYVYMKKGDSYLIVAKEFAVQYEGYETVEQKKGSFFENAEFAAPFGDRISKGINGEFVTLEDGTGIVHIAPGHGEEDYMAGKKYGLPILSPVNEEGRFTADAGADEITGMEVFKSDPVIIKLLEKENMLYRHQEIEHSYPHCWRCKNPVIFRATKQWFMDINKDGLRENIIQKLKDVGWYPEVSIKRISSMIENRPDWCLSRQRLWGVPIPVFYCKECGEALATEESFNSVIELVKAEGSDGWFEKTPEEILNSKVSCKCGSNVFEKEEDILDVWFDSGVSSFAVLETREELRWPADMYLEGSDQHRGWFQTSVIPAAALRNEPPYKKVLTHGFIVDSEGKKMSKSIGNVISPQEVIRKYGADLLRLWVASENYFRDVKISEEILAQTVTAYRRIRNTIRFILGNTSDLRKEIEYKDLTSIDKFMLHKFYEAAAEILENYDNFLFYRSARAIHDFCNTWLSSFYFNILKDRLYVLPADSPRRRSSQTALRLMGKILLKLISPVLSHTAEESWQLLKSEQGIEESKSIYLEDFNIPEEWKNSELEEEWRKIVELRNIVLKKIEEAKEKQVIKDPLESRVKIDTDSREFYDWMSKNQENLKEYFIVSSVEINLNSEMKEGAELQGARVKIDAGRAEGEKCQRCWLKSEDIVVKNEVKICGRCARIVSELEEKT